MLSIAEDTSIITLYFLHPVLREISAHQAHSELMDLTSQLQPPIPRAEPCPPPGADAPTKGYLLLLCHVDNEGLVSQGRMRAK